MLFSGGVGIAIHAVVPSVDSAVLFWGFGARVGEGRRSLTAIFPSYRKPQRWSGADDHGEIDAFQIMAQQ